MKDYVTAEERLKPLPRRRFFDECIWTMVCVGMLLIVFYELLNEVNYV